MSALTIPSLTIPTTISHVVVDITLSCVDKTANGNSLAYFTKGALYTVGGVANLLWIPGTGNLAPNSIAQGTGSSATIAVSADTTNGGLKIVFTAPSSNTWHITGRVNFTEVA